MPPTTPDRRLARKLRQLGDADAAAAALEFAVRRAWSRLTAALRGRAGVHHAHAALRDVRAALAPLPAELLAALRRHAHPAARRAYRHGAEALADALPDGALTESLTVADLFRRFILPAPRLIDFAAAAESGNWWPRLSQLTRLVDADRIAGRVFGVQASGGSVADVARDVLPLVDGVRSAARRVARDAVLGTAHAMQMAAWEEAGDFIAGYAVVAVLDSRTRPDHRARHGTRYWKRPRPGQKGLGEMPRPPYEADGKLAYNCRCLLVPIPAAIS